MILLLQKVIIPRTENMKENKAYLFHKKGIVFVLVLMTFLDVSLYKKRSLIYDLFCYISNYKNVYKTYK